MNIVSGHNEPTFTEYFDVEFVLPAEEERFLALLRAKNIRFRVIDASRGDVIPISRHRQEFDASDFIRVYEIYGGVDEGVSKRFRAYIDSRGFVTYIENAFSYTGL